MWKWIHPKSLWWTAVGHKLQPISYQEHCTTTKNRKPNRGNPSECMCNVLQFHITICSLRAINEIVADLSRTAQSDSSVRNRSEKKKQSRKSILQLLAQNRKLHASNNKNAITIRSMQNIRIQARQWRSNRKPDQHIIVMSSAVLVYS